MPRLRPFHARAKPVLTLLALLVVAVAAERLHWFGRLRALSEPHRAWIWSADPPELVVPRAFFVARDFEVGKLPATARMEVLGDPEYIVYLNNQRIGSDVYRAGQGLDVFEVAPRLRTGTNRVVLELRSAVGSGGATLRIVDGSGHLLVATDSRWHLYGVSWKGLMEGSPFWGEGYAKVLGLSPFGRWGSPRPMAPKPLFDAAVELEAIAGGRSVQVPLRDPAWHRLHRRTYRGAPLGALVEIDFGAVVSGYLHLDLASRASAPLLLRYSASPVNRRGWIPDEIVLPIDRRGYWQAAVPRSFRFIEIAGAPEVSWAAVMPVHPEAWRALALRGPSPGLLNIRPPGVPLPVVDGIWKELIDLPLAPPRDARPAHLKRGGAGRRRERPPRLGGPRPRAGR
jgi:hypothetical protein